MKNKTLIITGAIILLLLVLFWLTTPKVSNCTDTTNCNTDSTVLDTVRYPKDSSVEIDSLPVDTIKIAK